MLTDFLIAVVTVVTLTLLAAYSPTAVRYLFKRVVPKQADTTIAQAAKAVEDAAEKEAK